MQFDHLLYEKADGVVTITINRAEVLNSLSAQTITDLDAAFDAAAADDDIGVLILTGAGEKSFVAGADIPEIAEHNEESGRAMAGRGQAVFRKLETMGKPSIAAVNGFALGGGCELAMACTIRICAERAKFGQPEVNLGVIPGYAGTQRLPRIVGRGVAIELIVTGRPIRADEALRIGLVTQVVPAEDLLAAAHKIARLIRSKGPLAVRAAMQAVDRGLDLPFEEACKLEAELFGKLCDSEDKKEGLGAFLEKRRPEFKGT